MKNTIELKKEGLYLNGEKFFLLSGDFHYFRTLPDGWRRRLRLMKDFGLTAVTTYVPWNLTEPERGTFCFEGRCDLERFLKEADEEGLKVVLRCSPYLCGEWEFGGLPYWLLKDRTLCLRSSDPKYLEPLNEYNKVLCDLIRPYLYTNGGPIILVGLENEYGSFGDDKEYLKALCDFYRNEDIDVPFVSANGVDPFKYLNGTLPDNWNGIDCGAKESSIPQFDKLRALQPDKPLMVGEAWVGSIMFWGRSFVKNTSGEEHVAFFREALKQNVAVNFYMFCGGTNFEFTNGALSRTLGKDGYYPLCTSYDYNAPISEEGTPTPKYYALRDVLDEYLGKEKRPHVDPFYEAQNIDDIKITETARYEDNLDALVTKRVKSHKIICMEDMDQDYGFIRYTSHMEYTDDRTRVLFIEGLADRATVYIDGKYIGTAMRQADDNKEITFKVAKGGSDLTILVENTGRINYGYNMYDYKGINGCVRVWILNEDGSHLYNLANNMHFTIESIPLKSTDGLKYTADLAIRNTPTFYKGTFAARAGVDTFLDMKGWKKGVVFVNGFNLGRYWDIGAQRTLYVPGELLKDENVVEIFELHTPKKDLSLSAIDHSLLCEPVAGTLASADFELL